LLALFTLLGFFSKETAIVIPAFALALPYLFRDRRRSLFLYAAVPAVAAAAFYAFMIFIMAPGKEHGEYIFSSLAVTLYTTCAAFLKYFRLVLLPLGLSMRHDIPWITTFFDWRVIAVISILGPLIIFTIYLASKKDRRAFPLVFFLITLLPISNIVPIRGHVMAERYFYMPLAGMFLAASAFLSGEKPGRRNTLLIIAPVVAVLAVLTVIRTREWKDDRRLFESAVKVAPDSLVVRANLYRMYLRDSNPEKANAEYREMIRINTLMVQRHTAYARQLQAEGSSDSARQIWTAAEQLASGNPRLLEQVRAERSKAGL